MQRQFSYPALERLSMLCTVLETLKNNSQLETTSMELGCLLNTPAHTIRKDLSLFGITNPKPGKAYQIEPLYKKLRVELGLHQPMKAALVGLGRIGTALLSYEGFVNSSFSIVAAFDSNINRIETVTTAVPLYPAYEIQNITASLAIDIGIIAVPAASAQLTFERLILGGIQGIINFAPLILQNPPNNVVIRNVSILGEMSALTSMIYSNSHATHKKSMNSTSEKLNGMEF